jgi:hypothetical protein
MYYILLYKLYDCDFMWVHSETGADWDQKASEEMGFIRASQSLKKPQCLRKSLQK